MLKQLALAALTAIALTAAASSANAFRGFCDDEWGCGSNGKSLNGVSLNGAKVTGSIEVDQPSVKAVVLPSGETVEVR